MSVKYLMSFTKACLLIVVFMSFASDTEARRKDETRALGAIDAKTFRSLTEAQKLTEQGQYEEAVQTLDKVKNNSKLNSYAKSQIWNFYAYIYASQEKYQQAIAAYQKVLQEPEAPDGLKLTAKYTLAQLYFQLENYSAVISLMEEWLQQVDKPTTTAHIILAQCYYQKQQYDPALKHLNNAIAINQTKGKAAEENWLRMKASIYFEENDLQNMLTTYQELLSNFPKVIYMKQIAGLYGELDHDRKRLTTYDALYVSDKLDKESEILNLAYMYIGQGIPYKAGKIIEQGMSDGVVKKNAQNIETLANAWSQANQHDKAIPVLESAARLSDKAVLYARLAKIHFDARNFEAAVKLAQLAEQKGDLKRRDNNQMLIGMALFNINDFEGALQAFRQAKSSKKVFGSARKWEQYTLSEFERLKTVTTE